MNYRMIKYTLGWVMLFEACFFTVPIICAAVYGEKEIFAFLISAAICAAVALLLFIGKPKNRELYAREGYVIVAMCWILLSLFGALPFIFSGVTTSFVDALFEAASGFSTTGASVLGSVEDLPRSINMWRCFTHWIGGMGVLVFIMAFLPLSGGRNMHIMKAESPGPSVSKLVPRVRTTALILYVIYFVLTALEVIFLLCGGMSLFEAICASFSTAGTGGFGIKNDSFMSYSPYLQIVVTVFMLLFSLNFTAYYLAFKGRIKEIFSSEIKAFLGVVAVAVAIATVSIRAMYPSFGESLRYAAFNVASIISTTGFSSTNFDAWPKVACAVLVLIMFIGACAGSTGGGMKVSRFIILIKGTRKELRSMLHPRRVQKITMDSKPVEPEVVRSVNAYIVVFVMVFTVSMLIVSIDSGDLVTAFTAVAATINNIGVGLSKVGPNGGYSFFSIPSKLVLIFNMIAGRLELIPMLILFSPATWRNK